MLEAMDIKETPRIQHYNAMTKAFSECIKITAVETDAEFKEIHILASMLAKSSETNMINYEKFLLKVAKNFPKQFRRKTFKTDNTKI
jgi:hypothetical protein